MEICTGCAHELASSAEVGSVRRIAVMNRQMMWACVDAHMSPRGKLCMEISGLAGRRCGDAIKILDFDYFQSFTRPSRQPL